MFLPAQGGVEGSVRPLLTKNPSSSFSCPSPVTQYLVWSFSRLWQTVGPIGPHQKCWHHLEARVEHIAPTTRAQSLSDGELPTARRPQAHDMIISVFGHSNRPIDIYYTNTNLYFKKWMFSIEIHFKETITMRLKGFAHCAIWHIILMKWFASLYIYFP